MKIVDLSHKAPGYNRIPEAHKTAAAGEQVLIVTRRGDVEIGMLFDKDILRLTTTVREVCGEDMPRLKTLAHGLYAVNLEPDAVRRLREE